MFMRVMQMGKPRCIGQFEDGGRGCGAVAAGQRR